MRGFKPILPSRNIQTEILDMQIGYFIFYEELNTLKFQDANQKLYELNRVALLSNETIDLQNSVKNIPTPYVVNKDGTITQYGANVLYSYTNSNNSNIVIFGSLQNLSLNNSDQSLNTDYSDKESISEKGISRNNKFRYFLVKEDAKGNLILYLEGKEKNGNIGIKIRGGENAGNLALNLNGNFEIKQVDKNGEETASIKLSQSGDKTVSRINDKYGNTFEFNENGTIIETGKVRIGKHETLKQIFIDLFKAIENIQLNHPQAPTIKMQVMNYATDFKPILERIKKFMDI